MDSHRKNFAPTLLIIKGIHMEYRYKYNLHKNDHSWFNDILTGQRVNKVRKKDIFFPICRSDNWFIEYSKRKNPNYFAYKFKNNKEKILWNVYFVTEENCSCPDYRFYRRKIKEDCKHITEKKKKILSRKIGIMLGEQSLISNFM